MLTVSIPTWNTPDALVQRSVESVLASEGVALRLIVVRDGGAPLPPLPKDSRLIVHEREQNEGRYYSDSVVVEALGASRNQVWAVLDADDWVEPGHYARLVRAQATHDGAVVAPYRRREPGRPVRLVKPQERRLNAADGTFRHLIHWCAGAYRLDRVHRAGGVHAGFRVGFDTLFLLMLSLTGPVGTIATPGYNWERRREGSLTTSKDTRFGSPQRIEAKRRLVALYERAYAAGPSKAGQVIRDDVPPNLSERVLAEAVELRKRL